mmetsp:Transcript_9626/g.10606  ORF Transcript_9626/g.10606 Transcript_9626/m.10606 type:complete len:101 (-) Transcript_9626:313-615(-)
MPPHRQQHSGRRPPVTTMPLLGAMNCAVLAYVVVAIILARHRVFQSPFFMIMGFVAAVLGCCPCILVFFAYPEPSSESVNDNSQNEQERSEGPDSNVEVI